MLNTNINNLYDYTLQQMAAESYLEGASLYSLGSNLATVFTELHCYDTDIQFGETSSFNDGLPFDQQWHR